MIHGKSFWCQFWGVGIWMQKDSNRSNASPSVPPEDTKESDRIDGQEDVMEDAPMTVEPVGDLTTSKRVVFGGTFPIDRPMSLNLAGAGTTRIRQQMSLTLKTPRTFAIDEPIREDNSAEVRSSDRWFRSAQIWLSASISSFLLFFSFSFRFVFVLFWEIPRHVRWSHLIDSVGTFRLGSYSFWLNVVGKSISLRYLSLLPALLLSRLNVVLFRAHSPFWPLGFFLFFILWIVFLVLVCSMWCYRAWERREREEWITRPTWKTGHKGRWRARVSNVASQLSDIFDTAAAAAQLIQPGHWLLPWQPSYPFPSVFRPLNRENTDSYLIGDKREETNQEELNVVSFPWCLASTVL